MHVNEESEPETRRAHVPNVAAAMPTAQIWAR